MSEKLRHIIAGIVILPYDVFFYYGMFSGYLKETFGDGSVLILLGAMAIHYRTAWEFMQKHDAQPDNAEPSRPYGGYGYIAFFLPSFSLLTCETTSGKWQTFFDWMVSVIIVAAILALIIGGIFFT